MKIKCGKCSEFQKPEYHASVEAVRLCYAGEVVRRWNNGEITSQPLPSQAEEAPTEPKPENPARMSWDFPSGHYAVEMDKPGPNREGKLHFFQVDKPADGKWEGWTFLKEQASDEKYPVKGRRMLQVLQLISEDWEVAMLRYGKEIGKCGHCNRTLTDEDSRARGIGPVCAKKMESASW